MTCPISMTPTESGFAEASAALERGDTEAALAVLRQALEGDPQNALCHFQIGSILLDAGRHEDAVAHFREAHRIDPNIAEFPLRIGMECARQGLLDEAESSLQLALGFGPNNPAALSCLGDVYRRQGRVGEAIPLLEAARRLAPASVDVLSNLGIALQQAGHGDQAIAVFEEALRLHPSHPLVLNNLGMALKQSGRIQEALTHLNTALQVAPQFAEARLNRAMLLLLTGRFKEGWREYEARPKWPVPDGQDLAAHLQAGLPLDNRTVLLHAEQGLGDLIQFVRYAKWLADRGAKVVVECPVRAHELMRGVPGVNGVVDTGALPAEFDLNLRLLSLPGLVHPHAGFLDAGKSYMKVDPALVAPWAARLGPATKVRAGIVWTGSPAHPNNSQRSIPLALLQPLLEHPRLELYSLQAGAGDAGLGPPERDWGHQSLTDTAAIMMALDLVITVDTMPAHLAGALGRPVWTLLSFVPDWRWGLESHTTPWYPTMKLFRQPKPGNFDSMVERIGSAVDEWTRDPLFPESAR